MFKFTAIGIIFSLCTASAVAQEASSGQSWAQIFNLGVKYQAARSHQKAIESFQRVLELRPKESEAMLGIADSYLELKQRDKAIEWAKRAVELEQNSPHARYKYAYILRHTDHSKEAAEEYKQVVRLKPDDFRAIKAVASCYSDQGLFKEAVEWYQKYLKANPKAPDFKRTSDLIADLSKEIALQGAVDALGPDYYTSALTGGVPERWPAEKIPLKIYIDAGKNVTGMKNSNVGILAESFKDWIAGSQGRLSYQLVPTAVAANIVCTWTSNHADVSRKGSDDTAGITVLNVGEKGARGVEIQHVVIKILTVGKLGQTAPVEDSEMKAVCLHEIGHALGLGHSPSVQDVMYFLSTNTALSDRDRATLLRFYDLKPPH